MGFRGILPVENRGGHSGDREAAAIDEASNRRWRYGDRDRVDERAGSQHSDKLGELRRHITRGAVSNRACVMLNHDTLKRRTSKLAEP